MFIMHTYLEQWLIKYHRHSEFANLASKCVPHLHMKHLQIEFYQNIFKHKRDVTFLQNYDIATEYEGLLSLSVANLAIRVPHLQMEFVI